MDKYLLTPGRGEGKVRGGPQPLDGELGGQLTERLGVNEFSFAFLSVFILLSYGP